VAEAKETSIDGLKTDPEDVLRRNLGLEIVDTPSRALHTQKDMWVMVAAFSPWP
jgi:hypothetical protein